MDLDMDLEIDLDRLRPRCLLLLRFTLGGVSEGDRPPSKARVRAGEPDLEYEDPVYDE